MSDNRANILYRAQLADKAGRYRDMCNEMRTLAEMDTELKPVERKMLSFAYKSTLESLRGSLRALSTVEEEETNGTNRQENLRLIRLYQKKVQGELTTICGELIQLLDNHAIVKAQTPESQAFYHKMKGDNYRYMAEFISDDARAEYVLKCANAYKTATELSSQLEITHPLRLEVTLNLCIFYDQIMNDCDKATSLAKVTLSAAVKDLDNCEDLYFRDTITLLQLFVDNLKVWEGDSDSD